MLAWQQQPPITHPFEIHFLYLACAMASSSKRPRGWRLDKAMQDDVLQDKCQSAELEHSCLATLLLNLWAQGDLSAISMQKIAYAAILDGAQHEELGNLAKCGNFGQIPGNVSRDVHATFLPCISLAPACSIEAPVMHPKTSQKAYEDVHFFLPHLMFWSMMLHYPAEAAILFAIDKVESFWEGVVGTNCPKLDGHPVLSVPNFQTSCIPLFIHGDGVEYSNKDSLMTYSWGALLSAMGSQDSSILLASFPKSCTWQTKAMPMQETTWYPILRYLAWSFQALFDGVHPILDPDGNPFPAGSMLSQLAGKMLCESGHRCVVWTLEGDQDYFCNVLKLPHWATASPCWACDTCTGDPIKCWKKLKPLEQGWAVKDAAQARATLSSEHPFFEIPGVTSMMVGQDGLHILFCEGVLSHVFGSILHLWCWRTKGRQTVKPADCLASIFSKVQEGYSMTQATTRVTNLNLKMFTNPANPHTDWAFLKLKGAETKHLLKPLASIAETTCSDSEVDRRIASCLKAMDRLVDIMDEAGLFFTEQEHAEFKAAGIHFFGHYSWLNSWAVANDRYLFHITIKFHMLWHLIQDAKHLNPRCYWCFRGEDYVGKISNLTASVAMGVISTRLTGPLSHKYRHWLHLRLTRGNYNDK